jgi:hypothetical protein
MLSVAFDQRRLACAIAALAVLCAVSHARPESASAAAEPRFLLAEAPSGVSVHRWPGGPVSATIGGATPLGTTTWLWITNATRNGAWGRAVLPLRPNGRAGWISLRGLRLVRTSTWVRASLADRRIWLMQGRRPVATWAVAIGAQATPTPVGAYSVTDRVDTGDPYGPFGWYAFGLSGHQPNLAPGWTGGDQLAIHGTNDPASIGHPSSAGCLRVSAEALAILKARVQLGTPVIVMRTRQAAQRTAIRASYPPLSPRRPAHRPASRDTSIAPRIDVLAADVAAAAPLTRHAPPDRRLATPLGTWSHATGRRD